MSRSWSGVRLLTTLSATARSVSVAFCIHLQDCAKQSQSLALGRAQQLRQSRMFVYMVKPVSTPWPVMCGWLLLRMSSFMGRAVGLSERLYAAGR